MSIAVGIAALVLFVVAFRLARIVPVASAAVGQARGALAVLGDRTKSDDEKERAARAAAGVLFGRFVLITGLTVLALIPAALCILLASWLGFAEAQAVMDALLSPWLIAAAVLFFAADYLIWR